MSGLGSVLERDDSIKFIDEEADENNTNTTPPTVVSEEKTLVPKEGIQAKNVLNLSVKIDKKDVDNELESAIARVPLRHPSHRRKSVSLSPRMIKAGLMDEECGSNSPGNSITSINSLASLLKEKMQMLPTTIKKKKPNDYKTRAFVAFLFLTIIFLVGLAYVLYQRRILQHAYFDRIKFINGERVMRIHADNGSVILEGYLGMDLNYEKVSPCLAHDQRPDAVCLEWMHRARLYLRKYPRGGNVECFNLEWLALSENVEPTDCITIEQNVHWYGGGQTAENAWPLDTGYHDFEPFVTGSVNQHQYGNILKRYFINTKGAAIIVDKNTPLHFSVFNRTEGKQLCFKAAFNDFAYIARNGELPSLNYSICTANTTSVLFEELSEQALWDGLKEMESLKIYTLLSEPLWHIKQSVHGQITQETILNYTESVINLGFLRQGNVLIDETWQKHAGDFMMDEARFTTFTEALEKMHRRGFKIVFSIQPFVSTESYNFAETVKHQLLVTERREGSKIPALTSYKISPSAAMLDITKNTTTVWLTDKLQSVLDRYPIDAFYLDLGTAYDMPYYYKCEKPLKNPDFYKSAFVNKVQDDIFLLGVSSAIERPKVPAFVSMPEVESSWDGLRQIIPTILTYGLMGFPFVIPGAVGGDYRSNYIKPGSKLPDKELYMRWLQLATFLPVVHFSNLPNVYGDDKILKMTKNLTLLRQTTVTPLLRAGVDSALNYGLPLIRPLWMLEPNEPACQVVSDEFAIGEKLIVAPILYENERERDIYLPPGAWRDGIDGSLRKGNRWIHMYKVAEDQIAFFERMEDDVRF